MHETESQPTQTHRNLVSEIVDQKKVSLNLNLKSKTSEGILGKMLLFLGLSLLDFQAIFCPIENTCLGAIRVYWTHTCQLKLFKANFF